MSQNENETDQPISNPKRRDNVFKWAIATFVDVFFAYFTKGVAVKKIEITLRMSSYF